MSTNTITQNTLPLLAGAILAALLLALGHWFPWPRRRPTRLQAYTYGVISLWLGYTLWRALLADWLTPAGLLLISIIGGAVTHLTYWLDARIIELRQAHKANQDYPHDHLQD